MKRIAAVVIGLVVLFAIAPPAQAYVHFGATSNAAVSVQWSGELFPDGVTGAILVRADNYADSLAAGALAGRLRNPVLMNPQGGLDASIEAELGRLGATLVRIIGGTSAVSEEAEDDLIAAGYDVERYAGTNRLETAAKVMSDATRADGTGLYAGTPGVYLARAFGDPADPTRGFADSLAAGMAAGTILAPLLLTETDHLSADTRTAIEEMGSITNVLIAGGSGAVSDAVISELEAMGITTERVAGVDRAETAAQLANRSYNPNGRRILALVDGHAANSWASGFAASAVNGGAVLVSEGATLPDSTASMLRFFNSDRNGGNLYCAPDVAHDACVQAESLLNG